MAGDLPGDHNSLHLHYGLDRAGCFKYEDVEGARSNDLPDQVPDEVKDERWNRFMEKQKGISEAKLQAKVGQTIPVLVDEVDTEGAIARSMADAPEIDGKVFLDDEAAKALSPGDLIDATIDEASDYDLYGTVATS